MSAYSEAMTDPKRREIGPGMVMRPFHEPVTGMDQPWHVYCAEHPDFGWCGSEGASANEALRHGNRFHRSPRTGDTP